jgi:predicted GNAT family acetyltransferase
MRNYAIPDDDVRPSVAEVEALVSVFRGRGLMPRMEYAEVAAPELEPVLVAAGFVVDARLVLMGCRPGPAPDVEEPADFVVSLAETDEDHAAAIVVADQAYGEPGPPPGPEAIAARKAMTAAGGAVAVARHRRSREPAGSGLFAVPRGGVSELAAVGTHPGFRGRGVASAVTARLAKTAIAAGVELLWLTPEDATSERICARVGFVQLNGHMIHASTPPPP